MKLKSFVISIAFLASQFFNVGFAIHSTYCCEELVDRRLELLPIASEENSDEGCCSDQVQVVQHFFTATLALHPVLKIPVDFVECISPRFEVFSSREIVLPVVSHFDPPSPNEILFLSSVRLLI